MSNTNKNNRFNNIISDLKSGEQKKVLTAIKQLRKHGKVEAILPLLDLLTNTENQTIKKEIEAFLFDLKDASVVNTLIEAIDNNKYKEIKDKLISIFWQSSLDASEHLSFFVRQAIEGTYMTCLEVLSVIDNFTGYFQENEITDARFDIEEVLDAERSEKKELLLSIKNVIEGLNVEY